MMRRLSIGLGLLVGCGADTRLAQPAPQPQPHGAPSGIDVARDAAAPPIAIRKEGATIVAGGGRTWVVLASGRVASWGIFDADAPRHEARPKLLEVTDVAGIRRQQGDYDRVCFFQQGASCDPVSTEQPEGALARLLGPGRLAAGSPQGDSACIVTDAGLIRCAGVIADEFAPQTNVSPRSLAVREHGTLDDVLEIAVGDMHACALRRRGEIACWGHIGPGLLGDGRTWERTRAPVRGIDDATRIAVGELGACALRKNGRVACWGDAGLTRTATAVDIPGVESATRLVANGNCGLRSDGKLQCWKMRKGRPEPFFVDVADARDAAWAGDQGLCVVRASGSVECHDVEGKKKPVVLGRGAGATAIAYGTGGTAPVLCVLMTNARVRCWNPWADYSPATYTVPKDAVEIEASGLTAYGLGHDAFVNVRTRSGALLQAILTGVVWSEPGAPRRKPKPNDGMIASSAVPEVETGIARSLTSGHVVHLDGHVTERGSDVEGVTDAVDIGAARHHACIVHRTGAVSCWGRELGAAHGRGESAYAATPIKIVLPEPPML